MFARRRRRSMYVCFLNATQDVSQAQAAQTATRLARVSPLGVASAAAVGVSCCLCGTPNLLLWDGAALHGAMAPWPKMTSAVCQQALDRNIDAFLYRLVIAPAFNLVKKWVHFLLSVIMHLTKSYFVRSQFLSNLGHDVYGSIRLRRLYRAPQMAQPPDCMHAP